MPGDDGRTAGGTVPGNEGRTAGGSELGVGGRMTPELGGGFVPPAGVTGAGPGRLAGGTNELGRGVIGAPGRLFSSGVMRPGEGEEGGFRVGRGAGGGLGAGEVRGEWGRTDGGGALPPGPWETLGPLEPAGGTTGRLGGVGGELFPAPGTCPTRPATGLFVEGLGRTLGGGLETTAPGIPLVAGGRY